LQEDVKKLTIEEIRMIQKYKNITNDEAELIIETIYKLSELAYYILNK